MFVHFAFLECKFQISTVMLWIFDFYLACYAFLLRRSRFPCHPKPAWKIIAHQVVWILAEFPTASTSAHENLNILASKSECCGHSSLELPI